MTTDKPQGEATPSRRAAVHTSATAHAAASGIKGARGAFELSAEASVVARGIPGQPGTMLGDLALCARAEHPEPERMAAALRLVRSQSEEGRRPFAIGGVFDPRRWSFLQVPFLEWQKGQSESRRSAGLAGLWTEPAAWEALVVPCLVEAAQGVDAARPVGEWYREVRRRLRRLIETELVGQTLDSRQPIPLPDEDEDEDGDGNLVLLPREILRISEVRAQALIDSAVLQADIAEAPISAQDKDLLGLALLWEGDRARFTAEAAARFGLSYMAAHQRIRRARKVCKDLGIFD